MNLSIFCHELHLCQVFAAVSASSGHRQKNILIAFRKDDVETLELVRFPEAQAGRTAPAHQPAAYGPAHFIEDFPNLRVEGCRDLLEVVVKKRPEILPLGKSCFQEGGMLFELGLIQVV